jgi:hypothetical protein
MNSNNDLPSPPGINPKPDDFLNRHDSGYRSSEYDSITTSLLTQSNTNKLGENTQIKSNMFFKYHLIPQKVILQNYINITQIVA